MYNYYDIRIMRNNNKIYILPPSTITSRLCESWLDNSSIMFLTVPWSSLYSYALDWNLTTKSVNSMEYRLYIVSINCFVPMSVVHWKFS